jgi:hypothetical protein
MTTPERRANPKIELEKAVVKEAIEEWLDKQFAQFGKWSMAGIFCAIGAWAFYAWLSAQGFHK